MDGCPWERDRPRLSDLDSVAWQIFTDCQTQWEIAVGMGGAVRLGLKYDQVRVVAEAHGWAFNAALLARIRRLETLSLLEEQKRAARDEDRTEGSTVN